MAIETENTTKWDSKIQQKVLSNFGPILKRYIVRGHFEPTEDLLVTWYKTYQSFNFHKLLPRTQSGRDYAEAWEPIWLDIGRSLRLYQQTLHPVRCAYTRCAAPDSVLFWGCRSCHVKWYCGYWCQLAYVELGLFCQIFLLKTLAGSGCIPRTRIYHSAQAKGG